MYAIRIAKVKVSPSGFIKPTRLLGRRSIINILHQSVILGGRDSGRMASEESTDP